MKKIYSNPVSRVRSIRTSILCGSSMPSQKPATPLLPGDFNWELWEKTHGGVIDDPNYERYH